MKPSLTANIASPGLSFGYALVIDEPNFTINHDYILNVEDELKRFHDAVDHSLHDVYVLRNKVAKEQGEENATIFDAHQLLLKDPEMIRSIEQLIIYQKYNAAWALEDTFEQYLQLFDHIDDTYMKERVIDIKDVRNRILSYLLNEQKIAIKDIDTDTILIAQEITPSHIALANRQFVQGFMTIEGGRYSHAAIIANTQGIPALTNITNDVFQLVKNGDYIIVDGLEGQVYINPSSHVLEHYKNIKNELNKEKAKLLSFKNKQTVTENNERIYLQANIASTSDLKYVLNNGAEGIGLFRTEFSYMNANHFPTEEQSFQMYKKILENMNNKPVVIRTLDIGGDKRLDYWELPNEANPFLGLRAIRLSLSEKKVFQTQLRALLRSSIYGQLHIMFPMVTTMEELIEAKQMLNDEKHSLMLEGYPVSSDIKVGMMVETPAAALMAEQFAKHVDFFSIGTNDLIQYTFAADRMNEMVSYLYEPYHPAVLRLIKMVADAGNKQQIPVSICGDLASNQAVASLLVGLGVKDLSMPPSKILEMRQHMLGINTTYMEQLASEALTKSNAEEVKLLLSKQLESI